MKEDNYLYEIIKNIPIGIAISNEIGLIKCINIKFLDMFGYREMELQDTFMNLI